MGIRAIYTDDSGNSAPCEILYLDHANALKFIRVIVERVECWVRRDQIELPPHKTPADWQPEQCRCVNCITDHSPSCAVHLADDMDHAKRIKCTCGLVEE